MRNITEIIVHCSATKSTWDGGVDQVRNWHINPSKKPDGTYKYKGKSYPNKESLPDKVREKKGRGWSDVGYHYFVKKDGSVEVGRPIDRDGAHVSGRNKGTIGVCWSGGFGGVDDRTDDQKDSMITLIQTLRHDHGHVPVNGHNKYSSKSCPNYDAYSEHN